MARIAVGKYFYNQSEQQQRSSYHQVDEGRAKVQDGILGTETTLVKIVIDWLVVELIEVNKVPDYLLGGEQVHLRELEDDVVDGPREGRYVDGHE